MLWIWFQHLANEAAACAWVEVADRWWAGRHRRIRVRTRFSVRSVQGIRSLLCRVPRKFLEMETVVHDPTSPNVHKTRIVNWNPAKKAVREGKEMGIRVI